VLVVRRQYRYQGWFPASKLIEERLWRKQPHAPTLAPDSASSSTPLRRIVSVAIAPSSADIHAAATPYPEDAPKRGRYDLPKRTRPRS
jgi:hypothetical protein